MRRGVIAHDRAPSILINLSLDRVIDFESTFRHGSGMNKNVGDLLSISDPNRGRIFNKIVTPAPMLSCESKNGGYRGSSYNLVWIPD